MLLARKIRALDAVIAQFIVTRVLRSSTGWRPARAAAAACNGAAGPAPGWPGTSRWTSSRSSPGTRSTATAARRCRKHVEPAVPDAMPDRATLGHHAVALSGFSHDGLGVSIGPGPGAARRPPAAGGDAAGGLVWAWSGPGLGLAPHGRRAGAAWYEPPAGRPGRGRVRRPRGGPAGRRPTQDDPAQPLGRRGRRPGRADERPPPPAAPRPRPDPRTIAASLRERVATGTPPPLPGPAVADG